MNNCPNCGGDTERGRYAPGGCICKREPKPTGDEGGGIVEGFDYITPAAEVFGMSKYVLFIFAVIGAFGVILTKGILWG